MRSILSLALLLIALALPVRADMVLLMAEEHGCMWCARWNDDIAPIYPKTAEGRAAPLQRIDIHTPLPPQIRLQRALHYTPSFVLLQDNVEVGRIEGYPGEDFFWGLLGMLLRQAGHDLEASG